MACMPHSPNDVFIARYQGSLAVQESSDFIFELSSGQFIFRSILDEVKYKSLLNGTVDFQVKVQLKTN